MSQEKSDSPPRAPAGVLAFGLLAIAHAPLLIGYFGQLWARDHYQFFPFAILAIGFFVRTRSAELLKQWSVWCTALLILDVLLLVIAVAVSSTFLVAVGFSCLVTALFLSTLDKDSKLSLLYLLPLLVLIVRPPLGLDQRMVTTMQRATTTVASRVLDKFGYVHHRAGNVIELTDKDLLLEEACSGVQSLFTVLFVAVFVSVYHRRSAFHLGILVVAAVAWAFSLNVVRIIAIAVSWSQWRIDLTSGWQHDLLGYSTLLGAIGLLFSTDGVVRYFLSSIQILQHGGTQTDSHFAEGESTGYRNPFIAIWNMLVQPVSVTLGRMNRFLKWNATLPRWSYGVPLAACLCIGLLGVQLPMVFGSNAPRLTPGTDANLLLDTDLPASLVHLQKQTFAVEQRNHDNADGAITNGWTYTDPGGTTCHVACDHAFSAWHCLEDCYIGRGWQVDSKTVVTSFDENWPAVEVRFSNDTGRKAWLVYSLFNSAGESVQPPQLSISASMLDRLFRKGAFSSKESLYQTQVFVEVDERLPEAVRQQFLDAHSESRRLMRDSLIARIREGA